MTTHKHAVPEEWLARPMTHDKKPEDLIGNSGLLGQPIKALVERAPGARMAG